MVLAKGASTRSLRDDFLSSLSSFVSYQANQWHRASIRVAGRWSILSNHGVLSRERPPNPARLIHHKHNAQDDGVGLLVVGVRRGWLVALGCHRVGMCLAARDTLERQSRAQWTRYPRQKSKKSSKKWIFFLKL